MVPMVCVSFCSYLRPTNDNFLRLTKELKNPKYQAASMSLRDHTTRCQNRPEDMLHIRDGTKLVTPLLPNPPLSPKFQNI
eukprot:5254766-Amphidinium_carterae.1